jgi:hypothetical protein
MGRKIDHEKMRRTKQGEAAQRIRGSVRKARNDSSKMAARSRPSVEEMFDDVQELPRKTPKET